MPTKPKPIRPTGRSRPRLKPVRPAVRGRKAAVGAGHTQALSRGLALLEALAAAPGGATLTVVADQARLPAPTAHRLLATLEQDRFVAQTAGGVWRVGVRAFRIGSAFLEHRNLVTLALPVLRELMEESGETTLLAVLDGRDAVVVEQVQCLELMRMSTKLGAHAPLHASALGKAMLAQLSDAAAAAALGDGELPAFTPQTLTDRERLAADLATARERGHALDDEEHASGLRSLAAPIWDEGASVWAAVALGGPTSRVTHERMEELVRLVRDAAHDITFALGGRPPRLPAPAI